jgi:hypothetical protein
MPTGRRHACASIEPCQGGSLTPGRNCRKLPPGLARGLLSARHEIVSARAEQPKTVLQNLRLTPASPVLGWVHLGHDDPRRRVGRHGRGGSEWRTRLGRLRCLRDSRAIVPERSSNMDQERFDQLTRSLASGLSRRRVLRTLGAVGAGGTLAAIQRGNVLATNGNGNGNGCDPSAKVCNSPLGKCWGDCDTCFGKACDPATSKCCNQNICGQYSHCTNKSGYCCPLS